MPNVWKPDRQRVLVVGATDWPRETVPRVEPVQLTFDPSAVVPADTLVLEVLDAIKTAPAYTYDERRSRGSWGATGLTIQDIEVAIFVTYAASTAAGLTVAAVIAALSKLFSRNQTSGLGTSVAALPADYLWAHVEDFLQRAFKTSDAKMHEMVQLADGSWRIKAESGTYEFMVTLNADGSIMQAKRLDE
jgi:hypothetical protein